MLITKNTITLSLNQRAVHTIYVCQFHQFNGAPSQAEERKSFTASDKIIKKTTIIFFVFFFPKLKQDYIYHNEIMWYLLMFALKLVSLIFLEVNVCPETIHGIYEMLDPWLWHYAMLRSKHSFRFKFELRDLYINTLRLWHSLRS